MKDKTDFQDSRHGGQLGFHIKTILAIFYQQVASLFPTKFRVNQPLGSETKGKIDFIDGPHKDHLWFSIKMIKAIYDLQAAPILTTQF